MAAVAPARRAAFAILHAVERGQSHSDDLLRGRTVAGLSEKDRHLATALVLGTLRWQIQLDRQIRGLLAKPDAGLDDEVRIALRLGAFQLLHLDRIPARAAIDESVELAKQAGHRFASGMVNAVLRKLALRSPSFLDEGVDGPALAFAHPAWMVERWVKFYGLDAARAICRHGQTQPGVTIRLGSDVERELEEAGVVIGPGELLTAARCVISGDVAATPAFDAGRVRLQDEGSQLVAELASARPVAEGGRILDACAAPGGKTLILAERNPHARIVACESSPARFEHLSARLAGLGPRVECRLADATALSEEGAYDLVLADVPCSGTGTLGRNPEIRHRLRLEDLARQAERQRAILAAALRALKPGGRVVYSTCSLEPEENEEVVSGILAASEDVRLVPITTHIEALLAEGIVTASGAEKVRGCLTAEGHVRLLPGVFQTDGFSIAMIERNG